VTAAVEKLVAEPLVFHHDRIDAGGWSVHRREGVPWFTPPAWLDPDQRPRRNRRVTELDSSPAVRDRRGADDDR